MGKAQPYVEALGHSHQIGQLTKGDIRAISYEVSDDRIHYVMVVHRELATSNEPQAGAKDRSVVGEGQMNGLIEDQHASGFLS